MSDSPYKIIFIIVFVLLFVYFRRDTFLKSNGRKKTTNISIYTKKQARVVYEEIRQGYIELVDLVIHNANKKDLHQFILAITAQNFYLKERDKQDYAVMFLYTINEYIETNAEQTFISCIDFKTEVSDVIWNIEKHFTTEIISFEALKSNKKLMECSISADGVFLEINDFLRPKGIALAFIDDQSDSYQLIVFSVSDFENIQSAVSNIGLSLYQNIQ